MLEVTHDVRKKSSDSSLCMRCNLPTTKLRNTWTFSAWCLACVVSWWRSNGARGFLFCAHLSDSPMPRVSTTPNKYSVVSCKSCVNVLASLSGVVFILFFVLKVVSISCCHELSTVSSADDVTVRIVRAFPNSAFLVISAFSHVAFITPVSFSANVTLSKLFSYSNKSNCAP